MFQNIKNNPVIMWAMILNIAVSLFVFVNMNLINVLAIGPESFFKPWQLWTHSFVHANLLHLGFNMLVLAKFAPNAIGHYSKNIQVGILFGLPFVIGLLMQIAFVFSPSAVIGYSGVLFAVIGFYLQQKKPGSKSLIIEIVIYHVAVIAFDFPVSITGHATGLIAGFAMSYWLQQEQLSVHSTSHGNTTSSHRWRD